MLSVNQLQRRLTFNKTALAVSGVTLITAPLIASAQDAQVTEKKEIEVIQITGSNIRGKYITNKNSNNKS